MGWKDWIFPPDDEPAPPSGPTGANNVVSFPQSHRSGYADTDAHALLDELLNGLGPDECLVIYVADNDGRPV